MRVCDERCWYAAGLRCTCSCGGMNHGKKSGRYVKPDPPDIFEEDRKELEK